MSMTAGMRLVGAALLLLLLLPAAALAEGCRKDQYGGLVCGSGKAAMRVFDETTSPSKRLAFAWRSASGVPTGDDFPDTGEVENFLVRLSDGAVVAKLGGNYWDNGVAHANRYDVRAVWSPDSSAVLEISDDRWDTYALNIVLLDAGDNAVVLDLRAVVEPALKKRLPARLRKDQSFQLDWDGKVMIDSRGNGRFTASLYVPKQEPTATFQVRFETVPVGGRLVARVVSAQRVR
jgi:hypothetical protein